MRPTFSVSEDFTKLSVNLRNKPKPGRESIFPGLLKLEHCLVVTQFIVIYINIVKFVIFLKIKIENLGLDMSFSIAFLHLRQFRVIIVKEFVCKVSI